MKLLTITTNNLLFYLIILVLNIIKIQSLVENCEFQSNVISVETKGQEYDLLMSFSTKDNVIK